MVARLILSLLLSFHEVKGGLPCASGDVFLLVGFDRHVHAQVEAGHDDEVIHECADLVESAFVNEFFHLAYADMLEVFERVRLIVEPVDLRVILARLLHETGEVQVELALLEELNVAVAYGLGAAVFRMLPIVMGYCANWSWKSLSIGLILLRSKVVTSGAFGS